VEQKLAVKVLRGKFDETTLRRLLRQIRVWGNIEHANIIPFLGISFDFHGRMPCLVSPFLRNGNIVDYLKKHPHASRLTFIHQTAEALLYLHNQGIVHGDIKGDNVLINDQRNACLVDFGISRIQQESGFTTSMQSGTMRYIAPEIYALDEDVDEAPPVGNALIAAPKFTAESDVWAFSMFIIQVFTERKPFSHVIADHGVSAYVLKGGRPRRMDCPQIHEVVWDKLCECWNRLPEKRPSMTELSTFFRSAAI